MTDRRRAAHLYAQPGASYRSVARELEVSASTVRRWVRSIGSETPPHGHDWQVEWDETEEHGYRWVCGREGCSGDVAARSPVEVFTTDCEGKR